MKLRTILAAAAAFAGALALTVTLALAGDPTPQDRWKDANASFEEKSYKKALEKFLELQKTAPQFEQGDELKLRIATCRLKLRQWVEAEEAVQAVVRGGDHYKLTGLLLLGRLYRDWPHELYEKGEEKKRGEWIDGSTYRWTHQEDLENSLRAFEEAKKAGYDLRDLYATALATNPGDAAGIAEKDARIRALSVEVNFELAQAVTSRMQHAGGGARWTDPVADAKRYDPGWTPNEKVLFLFDEVGRLDTDGEKRRMTAEAMRAKGLYLLRRNWWFEIRPEDNLLDTALAVWRDAVAKHPDSGIADQLQYSIGLALENHGRFAEALTEYAKVANWKDSKWESDAAYHTQEIRRPRLGFGGVATWTTAQQPEINLGYRNVASVALKLQRFDLPRAWELYQERTEGDFRGGDFLNFAAGHAADQLAGEEIRSWTWKSEDNGLHASMATIVKPEVKGEGAYLLTAEADGIVSRVVVVVSDLVLVERMAGTEAVYFAADAKTGDAVADAELRVLERITTWENKRQRHEDHKFTKKTGADGLATVTLVGRDQGATVWAWARKGTQFALGPGNWWYAQRDGGRGPRVDAFTDRPVYRPNQKVMFKATLRSDNGTGYEPAKGLARVRITDVKGNELFNRELPVNEFGSVAGEIMLGEEPPLGQYSIQVTAPNANGWHAFRVEEYKKPEMLVEVVSKTELARLGEGLTAEVRASYYFGGGVPNADVRYSVTRRDFAFWWREADEFDWYYGDRWGRPGHGWDGEVVASGTGKTDENGILVVEWSTQKAKTELSDRDHEYVVHAEVTDSTRRTIEGEGTVRVTRTQMYASLTANRGFYVAGSPVEIEFVTQNANNRPLTSEGSMTVARVVWDASIAPDGGWKDEPVITEPAKTDTNGRGYFKWQSDRDGVYAFTYTSKDGWGETVTGRTQVQIADPNSTTSDVRFSALNLSPEVRTCRPGETARVLLWSDVPGATVMLTTEAGPRLLSREVVRLAGKSRIIEIPLEEMHVPNFFLRALTVRDGQIHQSIVELFVPPAHRFLDVTATPSKPEYKPGEKARFDITAKDWQGKPVQAEFGISVFDKSVTYIAPHALADMRLLFWGGRRWANVELQTSRSYSTSPWTRDGNKYPKYKLHGDPMSIGSRNRTLRGYADGGSSGGVWDGAESERLEESKNAAPGAPPAAEAHGNSADDEGGGGERKKLESLSKEKGDLKAGKDGKPQGEQGGPEPVVRKNFADTAYWTPWVVTGADGKASIEFTLPDSLTTWRFHARGIDRETRVASLNREIVTRKTVMARLQAPRFFRERDELLLSAIVNNTGKTDERVKVTLKLEGGTLELVDKAEFEVAVAPSGEARVDWKVKAVKEGSARVLVSAIGREDSDAMQMDFPVYVHGMDKFHGWSGVIRADSATDTVEIVVPADRKISTTDLVIQVQPTMMGAILDALPYLIEYPYGCVEQTMSRFMPAVAVAGSLRDAGMSLEEIGKRRKLAYADLPPSRDPVFHTQQMQHMVEQGLARLYSFQNGAGGWGWWQDNNVDPFITAYVVNGLRIAKVAGAPVDENRFQNGVNALKNALRTEKDPHRAVYAAYVLAECQALVKKDLLHLYDKRDDLNSYGKALLAMALQLGGENEKAQVAIRNMEDFIQVDEKAGLAWWKREDKWAWWYWYGDDVEGNAAILRAYCRVDPKNPNTDRLAKWLLTNRQGVTWKSTRDTANSILALVEYAKVAGELSPEYTADVLIDGKPLKSFGVTADNVFTLDGEAVMRGDAVEAGKHTITVTKSGKGTAYWTVYLKYFSTEEDIRAAGSKLAVKRTYVKLTPRTVESNEGGRKVKRIEFDRAVLESGATVTSGDLIEIELTVDAPNDYEYLVFEDFKAAGCEPTEVLSGPAYGTIASNREFRDEKVAIFMGWLPRGTHKVSYRVRAEIPGHFHAMPVNGYAMYAPSVRAISDEFRLVIVDKPAEGQK
ncbi:MAG: hypothetical protein HUU15_06640 [Candidatus Brocadiae bacterium]|nr:hypothetical protein [Candidatus Brocadiia bacterium]